MHPTAKQILSFLDKAKEIRDIHEVLPSDDPEAANKAIVEVFYERFCSEELIIQNKSIADVLIERGELPLNPPEP